MKHRRKRRLAPDVAAFLGTMAVWAVAFGGIVFIAVTTDHPVEQVRHTQVSEPPRVQPTPLVPSVTDSLIWRPKRPQPVVDMESVAFERDLDAAIGAVVSGEYRHHDWYRQQHGSDRHESHGDRSDRHRADSGRHHAERDSGRHHVREGRKHFKAERGGRHRAGKHARGGCGGVDRGH